MSTAPAAVEKPRAPAEKPKAPTRHKPLIVGLLQLVAIGMIAVGFGGMANRTGYAGVQSTLSFVGGFIILAILAPRWADRRD